MHIVSYSDIRSNLKTHIDRTINDADVTLIHRKQGGNAVLMSETHFNGLMETLYLLSSKANRNALERAIAQHKSGQAQVKSLIEVDDNE